MGSVRFGGDPESYMDPPQMTASDKPGGVSIIASVLDLLGVHKQVAKDPKVGKAESPTRTTQSVAPPAGSQAPVNLPSLDAAESAFTPIQPMPSDWGKRYLESLKPIKTIDPNTAL